MNSQISIQQSSLKQWVAGFAAASILLSPSVDIPWAFEPSSDKLVARTAILSIALVIIGAIIGAVSADVFGRKRTLLATLIFVIPRLILIIFEDAEWIWIVQIFVEFGSGITCTVVPLYITEIASTNNRGNLMAVQQLVCWIGMTIMIYTIIISDHFDSSVNMSPIIGGILLIISVLFHGITLAIFPETPHYLNSKKRYQEAGESLAFFRGINHVKIREETIDLSGNVQTNKNRPGCFGKVCEIMQFENRRSLAIIFSLIVIRWVCGQSRNYTVLFNWANYYYDDERIYALLGTYAGILIFAIFITFTIGSLRRKLSLLLLIFGCFIAAIVGIAIFKFYYPVFCVVLFIQHFGHLVLVGTTLAYTGEFFPINVRAFAIAVVISFDILVRNMVSLTDGIALVSHVYTSGGTFLIAFFFVLIFFPKINKIPSFEIAIETYAGGQYL